MFCYIKNMLIGIPKEIHPGETRCPFLPFSVDRLIKKGARIAVEAALGATLGISDEEYKKAGASLEARANILKNADIILRLRKPPAQEIAQLKKGCIHISFLDPFNEKSLVQDLAKNNISALSMEMIPRTTRAQKMDALSSQANLAGYVTVILAAERLPKIFPLLMTPAGTIQPARVFIIGAGVAGLQAIATAKRLGARVETFDTRPVVKEQVQSLGAKFVEIDLGQTGQTTGGYAKALAPEQLEKQRQGMARVCAQSDVVITTAQVFGRKAPLVITKQMVAQMKPGSIIVDMAVESGGNVEGSKLNEEVVTANGVRIIGFGNLPGKVAVHASQMYSANLHNLIEEYWDNDSKTFKLNTDDEIIQGALVTHQGAVVNEMVTKT